MFGRRYTHRSAANVAEEFARLRRAVAPDHVWFADDIFGITPRWIEAFAAEVPVIARPSGGVPETAGDAALLVDDRDPAVIAELIALAASDDELRADLVRRGRERLAVYAPERSAVALRAALERLS